jgi:multicomponent Na+:H+ antiporter subunit D
MSSAGLASLLPLPVAIPIGGAVVAPLLSRISKRLPLYVCIGTMGGAVLTLGLVAPTVWRGRLLTHFLGHWAPFSGNQLGDTFGADPFGLTFALVVASIGGLLLVYSLSELSDLGSRELGGYACLFQLLLAALIGIGLTADMVNLFVWFEVAAIASYGLTGFFLERPIALEAAFKILVLTNLASFAVFVGAAMIYSDHGALNFGQIHHAVDAHLQDADLVALAVLVTGMATKAGIMPFHGWLADAHTAAPGPVSALFSGLMVNLGVVVIARLALQIYGPVAARPLLGLVTVLGAISAVLGAVMALAQDDLKRVLAYDTISQMGVLLVGFGGGHAAPVAGATYHLVNHALFKALLFLCAGAIVHSTGLTHLSQMGGLGRRMPLVAGAFVLGVIAIAGIPPLNGYVSLGLIHDWLKDSDPAAYGALVLAQIVTVAALSRAAYLAFFRRRSEELPDRTPFHPGMVAAMGILGTGCVAFGIFPYAVLHHIVEPATGGLLAGPAYANGLLTQGGARLPVPAVSFSYFSASGLGVALGSAAAGLLLAAGYVRLSREPAPVRWLRALHTGSVNDYAAYLTVGAIITVGTLLSR